MDPGETDFLDDKGGDGGWERGTGSTRRQYVRCVLTHGQAVYSVFVKVHILCFEYF